MDQAKTAVAQNGSASNAYLIASSEEVVSRARIIDSGPSGQPVVTMGSTAVIEDETTGETSTYRGVGPHWPLASDAPSTVPVGRVPLDQSEIRSATVVLQTGLSRTLRVARLEVTPAVGEPVS